MPPSLASDMASGASVTVSMAAERSGTLRSMPANVVDVETSFGKISLQPGTTRTSSNVRASNPVNNS